MSQIRVECYSGYRAEQRPERFTLRGRQFEIEQVEDQWYSPGAIYFRVSPGTGTTTYFGMTKDRTSGLWTDSAPAAESENWRLPR